MTHDRAMKRRATAVTLDDELLSAVEAAAARERTSVDEIVERALRSQFAAEQAMRRVLDRPRESDPGEEVAMSLAQAELRAVRRARRAGIT
jgi:hypothetical protein